MGVDKPPLYSTLTLFNNLKYSNEVIKMLFLEGKNRGPEDSQFLYLFQHNMYLGFHRLAINGYHDKKANQPFQINNIFIVNTTIVYGGKKSGSNGQDWVPLLEKIFITFEGPAGTPIPLLDNEFTDYNNSSVYSSVEVADITSSVSGVTNNCLVIYQTGYNSNATQEVHIRELDFTGNTWKTNDFPLTTTLSIIGNETP